MNWKTFKVLSMMAFLPVSPVSYTQEKPTNKISWNGYAQLRFTSNFNEVNSFAVRRMKLWINSTPGFSEHWTFHVQTTMTSFQNEKFVLQDVLATYLHGQFKFNLGQFIPQYSLQRFQPDYTIPLTERADVINTLIPDGTQGVRDIGLEGNYSGPNKILETWFGIFNGNGIKEFRLNNSGIMLTHKTAFRWVNAHLYTGYSLMFRKADQLQFHLLLPDSVKFSGPDFRWNGFVLYQTEKFLIQAEYLWANLQHKIADGYYILTMWHLGRNQVSASWNQWNDLIETSEDLPLVHLGYNRLLSEDKLKIMFDNSIRLIHRNRRNYFMTVQLQFFFN